MICCKTYKLASSRPRDPSLFMLRTHRSPRLARGSVVDPPGQPSSNQPTRTDRNCPSTTVRWRISGCLLPPQTPSKIPFYAPHPLVGWSDRLSVVTIHARWTDGHDEPLPTCQLHLRG